MQENFNVLGYDFSIKDVKNSSFILSINKDNFDSYKMKYFNAFNQDPTHLSLLSYDLVGLVYYLSLNSNTENLNKIFKKKKTKK